MPPAVEDAGPPAAEFRAALQSALAVAEPEYRLDVFCTTQTSKRSLIVFPSGVGIWDRTVEIAVPNQTRMALLQALKTSDFAAMKRQYGGKKKPGAKTKSGALRVRCSVTADIGGASKQSMQLIDGDQSAHLEGLATALLDMAEPLAPDGTSATDLSDGLQKLATGALKPESLKLRFVRLPQNKAEDGFIFGIRDGLISRQDYAPGRKIGDITSNRAQAENIETITRALLEAQIASLPVNLQAGDHFELEVDVLDHRKTVIARRFQRKAAASGADSKTDPTTDAQARLDRLLEQLVAVVATAAP